MENNKVEILHYICVDSTNRVAMQYEEKKHLLTFMSDTQTAGRGRMDREFFSYEGGLYMSVILEPDKIKIPYHICTPAAALAVKKSLEKYGVKDCAIKWVNDILLNGKKICGILTESKVVNNIVERIVVGIGINLSKTNESFPDNIKNTAGYADIDAEKKALCLDIVTNLAEYLSKTQEEVVSEYSNSIAKMGDYVTVSDYANNGKITGRLLGVDNDCYLKIELPDKSIRTLSSGEIL